MLKDEWNLDDGKPMKVFHGGMNLMNFKRLVKKYPKENIDPELKTCFLSLLHGCDEKTKSNSGISLKKRLQKLSSDFEDPGLGVQRK